MCGGIIHPGDDEPVTTSFDNHVLVMKNGPADSLQVSQPAMCLAEVRIVAGDVDAKRRCFYRSQWPCLQFAYVDRAVSDVADVAHDVGAERVHPRRHAGRPPRAIDWPVMRIGDDRDPQTIRAGPESGADDV